MIDQKLFWIIFLFKKNYVEHFTRAYNTQTLMSPRVFSYVKHVMKQVSHYLYQVKIDNGLTLSTIFQYRNWKLRLIYIWAEK